MFDTSTQHGFAPPGMLGQQPSPYGQQFGQPQNAGFVPIIGLVPQSVIVNLVAQCLQQAQLAGFTQQLAASPLAGVAPQSLFGHVPGQFGQSQPFGQPQAFGQLQPFGPAQYGQPQLWQSPWQAIGGLAGQPQYSGAGRGILTHAG